MAYRRSSGRRSYSRRSSGYRRPASRARVSRRSTSARRYSGSRGSSHTVRLVIAQDHSLERGASYAPGVDGTVGVARLGAVEKSKF